MCYRPVALVILSGLLLPIGPAAAPVRRPVPGLVLPSSIVPNPPPLDDARVARLAADARVARLAADARVARLSEPELLAALAVQGAEDAEIVRLLEALGRFNQSQTAVTTLIRWLEFEDRGGRKIITFREYIPLPRPAEESLKRIGTFAVPQLVEEYFYFFENTSLAARMGRHCHLRGDRWGNVLEIQDSGYRLSCLADVLSETPEAATRAVEFAWHHMRATSDDDRVQRAGRNLVHDVVRWYRSKQEMKPNDQQQFPMMVAAPDMTADWAALVPLLTVRPHDISDKERVKLLAGLGRFRDSTVVASHLIQWLEYRPAGKGYVQLGEDGDRPHALTAYPAAVALAAVGPNAAPLLVGDYLFYFENTGERVNRERQYTTLASGRPGWVAEVQSPAHRLELIVAVLGQDRETARRAVESARQRMAAAPRDDRVRRVCETLIRTLAPAGPGP